MANSQLPHSAFGGTVSALIINPLVMPGRDVQMASLRFAAGQLFEVAHVLGIGTDGVVRICNASATDGSQVPAAIMLEGLNTSLGGQVFHCMVKGAVNETALVIGPGHTMETIRIPLFRAGIHLMSARYSYA